MDEKVKKIIYIVLGAFILLFFFLFLISSCSNKKATPEILERRIVESAKKYYSVHKNELPSKNGVTTLSLSNLVSKGIIDELDKMLEKDTECSGSLTIENNNDYYMYSPKLNCKQGETEYNTSNLYDVLMDNIVTSGNGLYSVGDKYYFRGDSVDNYLIFDGTLYRIMAINSDHTIRIIEADRREAIVWDNRYNNDASNSSGYNDYVLNDIPSRIKDSMDQLYSDDKVLSKDAKGYIKETSLCIGKRSQDETINDGTVECSKKLNNQYIGLIQLNEYLLSSLDNNCKKFNDSACSNYNYLSDFKNSYWSITADSSNSYNVYKIYGNVLSTIAANSAMNRMVFNISENTNITGDGTENNPFIVTGLNKEIKK